MKVSVLINNYNYAEYVCEAIQSALSQSRPPDEVIIVDDGSIDESVALIESEFKEQPSIHFIAKSNEGQLSAFNAGFQASSGDLVFFLDADDLYTKDYLSRAIDFYDRHPDCGFLHCALEKFGAETGIDRAYPKDFDYGFSVIEALEFQSWRGGQTSSLSLRRSILEAFLPLGLEQDWRTRADDCLVFGAAMVGGHKYFLADPLVRYRVHERNAWYRKSFSPIDDLQREYRLKRLAGTVADRCGYHLPALPNLLLAEFTSAGSGRNIHDLLRYMKLVSRSPRGLIWKTPQWIKLLSAYLRMILEGRRSKNI